MPVVRWTFGDGTSTYTFEVNPNEGGSPSRRKNLTSQPTTAPDGVAIVYEGQADIPTGSFSGTVLTQTQYEAMVTWFNKTGPITMTDDLGHTFTILFQSFEPKRTWRQSHPWKHTYTVTYLVTAEA